MRCYDDWSLLGLGKMDDQLQLKRWQKRQEQVDNMLVEANVRAWEYVGKVFKYETREGLCINVKVLECNYDKGAGRALVKPVYGENSVWINLSELV